MKEDEVKAKGKEILEEKGYRVLTEVLTLSGNRDVILDLRGERVHTTLGDFVKYEEGHYKSEGEKTEELEFDMIWVECKGDVGISEALEGFIRTVWAVWYGGGQGILAIPNNTFQRLQDYVDFFEQNAKVVIGKGKMSLLNVETGRVQKL